jgi:hypothetical protein
MMNVTTAQRDGRTAALPLGATADAPDGDDADNSLDEAARVEQDYLRQRLRDELGREPTDEELNEWLREHTEGY